jgi:acetyl-CoA synthetase
MSSERRKGLFGFAAINPPSSLSAGARFPSARAYRDFLQQVDADPVAYWNELAGLLHWTEPPAGPGGAGAWFPGGRLNLTVACLDQWIENDAEGDEALIALDGQSRTAFSREELLSRVGILCDRMRDWQLEPGSRVLLALPRGYELLCAVLAGLRLGLTCVPLDPSLGDPGRIERRAEAAGCQAALTTEAEIEAGTVNGFERLPVSRRTVLEPTWERDAFAPPAPVAVDAMHPAFVLADASGRVFSLPTAGVALHGLSAYRCLLDGRGPGDLHWFQTPAHHASFLTGSLGALISGGRIAAPVTGVITTAGRFLEALREVGPRVVVIQAKILDKVVAACKQIDDEGPCGAGPALLVVDGVSVSPTFYQFVRHGLFDGRTHVVQVLSRPEASGFLAGPHPGATPVRPASAGLNAPGLRLVAVDSNNRVCRPNHGGLLALERVPPGLALELQQNPPPVPLGVRARMDADEQIWSVGEAKVELPDQTRIPSTELEALIASLPEVDQAAVVVARDARGRVHTRAFVKEAEGSAHSDLPARVRAAVAERFGPAAVPEAVQRVPDLPYSRSGKLIRSVLRRVAVGETDGLEDLGLVTDPELLDALIHDRAAGGRKD